MGGMNTGNATALLSGFYTKEDLLLNMLSEELGASVTAQDVAAQNPDAVAEKLDDYKKGIYDTRKQEIEVQYAKRPFAEVFMGSGPGFASLMQAHEVMVAGHPVWRDVQANVGVSIGMYEENLYLTVTPKGLNTYEQYSKCVYERSFSQMFSTIKELSPETLDAFQKVLKDFADSLPISQKASPDSM